MQKPLLDPEPGSVTRLLLDSLIHSPLLIGDLPEAKSFDRQKFGNPEHPQDLNLQQKLGHLYEDALTILLKTSDHIQLLEKNFQVKKDIHRTIGELDFLIALQNEERLIHLELATKFYLAVPTPKGVAYPGPDARDNYHRKLKRMRTHQLTLADKHTDLLPEIYRNREIETQQLIYGCIFDHITATEPATPEHLHPHCRRGRWLSEDECHIHIPLNMKCEIIPKALWPVPPVNLSSIKLEPWIPGPPLERCTLIRVASIPFPYFVAPAGYPLSPPDN